MRLSSVIGGMIDEVPPSIQAIVLGIALLTAPSTCLKDSSSKPAAMTAKKLLQEQKPFPTVERRLEIK